MKESTLEIAALGWFEAAGCEVRRCAPISSGGDAPLRQDYEGERVCSHARTKARRDALARRFKDPDDDLRLVIVCDMWLTGFDCPPLHTMYLDKPLAGHNLMQAIARANRAGVRHPARDQTSRTDGGRNCAELSRSRLHPRPNVLAVAKR